MEISNQEGEIPIPLNSTYVGGGGGVLGDGHHGHLIHHHHDPPPLNQIIPSTAPPQVPSNGIFNMSNNNNNNLEIIEQASSYKKLVKYKECLKNHAASMGGNATDGCGEFMPSGEEGTIEALKCSACNCHRNFHRKEIEGEQPASSFDTWPHPNRSMQGRKFILGPHHKNVLTSPEAVGYPTPTTSFIPSRSAPHPHHMVMSYNMGGSQLPSESDEQEYGGGGGSVVVPSRPTVQLMKKRFRTKFTQDQKEKMFNFAEKVGWKIQKQEESVVQHFCQEIGVKRRVLKVWMHNNKHNLAKKNALLSDI